MTYTVGTYSPGNEFVVKLINMEVLPTAPSPTTTHLTLSIYVEITHNILFKLYTL